MSSEPTTETITFPDAEATVLEVRNWKRTGLLPDRLTGKRVELGPWQHSTLATQLLKVVSHGK